MNYSPKLSASSEETLAEFEKKEKIITVKELTEGKDMNSLEKKWYTIEDLASMCGMSVETLKKGNSPLYHLSIDLKVETRLGGYHNTKKFYSGNVLKALKEYQIKNSVQNAFKDKETVLTGNISYIQQATVKQTIDNLLDNPDTLNMLLQESLTRNKALGIENKQLKEVLAEKNSYS